MLKAYALSIGCACLLALPAGAGNRVAAWGAGTNFNPTLDSNDVGQSMIPATLTNAVMVAAGKWHDLAVNGNGTISGWGTNNAHQLDLPVTNDYVAVACGQWHSLALRANGTVTASVGDDGHGQTDVPANLTNAVALAGGWYHSLGLKSDGTMVAWGAGGSVSNNVEDRGQSQVPAGLSNVVAIAAGGWHSLALKANGTITAWGAGKTYNPADGYDYGQATVPPGVSNVIAIAATAAASLALEANGRLVAWGDNTYGQTNIPAGLTNGVVAIAAGGWHFLALTTNGTVTAWGAGVGANQYVDYGQTTVPAGVTNVIQIAAGFYNSLALIGGAPPRISTPLRLTSVGTNGFLAQWPARNGRVYQLEYHSALTNQSWSAFPLQAGTGATNRFSDTNGLATQRFYQLSRW